MKILNYPHPALFTKCYEVTEFNASLKAILDQMWNVMEDSEGMGLSANQVGICERYFVMLGAYNVRNYIVNPVILSVSQLKANIPEGCLSAPGDFVVVPERSQTLVLKYQTETGVERTRVFEGIYAVCVQHEVEHLEGKSFLDSPGIDKKRRKQLVKKWLI